MKVYFVRHAESARNAHGLLHSYEEGELSESGIKQAEFVANRFSTIDVDLIISSPYERAKVTAATIQAVVKKPIKYTDLLGEFRGPQEIEGLPKDHPEVMRINKIMQANRDDHHWKYSNEESFHELRKRAIDLTKYLISQDKEQILCVTHGLFMRVILSVMMFGDNITREEMGKFMRFVRINNTGITMCEYLSSEEWRVITLNDHAHLG